MVRERERVRARIGVGVGIGLPMSYRHFIAQIGYLRLSDGQQSIATPRIQLALTWEGKRVKDGG